LNGGYFLNNTPPYTMMPVIDQLYGEAGNDWFFLHTASGQPTRIS